MKRTLRLSFTLVELLVVIAIISILSALLIPAVHEVKESGKRAKCQSNIHQIGVAIHLYSSEFKGLMPYAITMAYEDIAPQKPAGVDASSGFLQDLLIPYIGGDVGTNSQVYICPATKMGWVLAEPNRNDYRYNYFNCNGWSLNQSGRLLDSALLPAEASMVFDKSWTDWTNSDLPHNGVNVFYADGHAAYLDAPKFLYGGTETNAPIYGTGW